MVSEQGRKRRQSLRYAGELLAVLYVVALVALVRPVSASPLDQAMDRVFTVRSADAADRFLGSAFLWGDGSVAVTSAHVVAEAEAVRLTDRNGAEETALVIARDRVRDVAVLAVAPGRVGLSPAPEVPGLGTEVFALGAPLGVEFTLTEGLVSATARQADLAVPLRLLQHDAAVNPGSSGGPLVDADGRLLGMNSRIADGSRMFVGIAFAIAAADLQVIVGGLVDESLPPFPILGLRARPVDRQVADVLGVPAEGLLVDGVEPDGSAARAGLAAGDVIVAVDGTALQAPGDLVFLIEQAVARGETGVEVVRDGKRISLSLVFDDGALSVGLRTRQVPKGGPERVEAYRLATLGVTLDDDALVIALTQNSPALAAGLALGDRVRAINGVQADVADHEIRAPVLILVEAPGGATRHIYLDPWNTEDRVRPIGGANVLDPAVVVF